MAIVNRDLSASEQKEVLYFVSQGAVATGTTKVCHVLPYPCTLESVRSYALGVSSAMQVAFQVARFTSGGATAINLGISNMILQNAGLSGVIGYSGLAAAGSTLLQLQAGDVLQFVTSVANGNATDLSLNFVIKKVQDIVSYNGVVA